MKIDLSDIAGTPGAHGRYSISEDLVPVEGLSCIGPVRGEIRVENIGSLLLVRGRLDGLFRLSCTRCLGDFDQAFSVEVEDEFATEDTAPDIETVDRDEPAASAISDYLLDTLELVRQQVLLNAPMAPVCRPDCPGICPECGQNLNEGPCGCVPEAADSRWTQLRDLLPGAPEKED
ncbi:MAG: DUF177 domain-containing protein [Armatimonadetes bacterium]|nr:DUF177 domain-containing protein [Armatimonadota bacterium]